MLLVEFFCEESCKGTELLEGWYWHQDDGEGIGGPFKSQDAACEAARNAEGWHGT